MTDDEKPVDLEQVRKGDEHLERAKELHRAQKRVPRPVPVEEIAMEDEPHTYSLKEAAAIVGLHTKTLRRAIHDGELKAFGGGKGGAVYRISRVELAKWWRDRGGGELFEDEPRE